MLSKTELELIMMSAVALITGISILGGSIYRKDGKWKCLLFEQPNNREIK